jgi:hypothetical protein
MSNCVCVLLDVSCWEEGCSAFGGQIEVGKYSLTNHPHNHCPAAFLGIWGLQLYQMVGISNH